MARAIHPNLHRRRQPSRLLPRPLLPRRRHRRHETAAQGPARSVHRVRGRIWLGGRLRAALCRRRHRSGEGRAGPDADCVSGAGGGWGDLGVFAWGIGDGDGGGEMEEGTPFQGEGRVGINFFFG